MKRTVVMSTTSRILWICWFWSNTVESFVSAPLGAKHCAAAIPCHITSSLSRQQCDYWQSMLATRRRRLYSSNAKSADSSTTAEASLKDEKENDHQQQQVETKASDDFVQKTVSSWTSSNSNQPEKNYDYPWTDLQEWALYDQLARYTVQVPTSDAGDDKDSSPSLQVVTLWRTLSNEVVELSGYPLQFLVDRQMELQQAEDEAKDHVEEEEEESTIATAASGSRRRRRPLAVMHTSPTILPYLDAFDFTPAGGLTGTVYGVQGLADGTRIETSPVQDVQTTIPKGYVRTVDGSVMYELGRPLGQHDIYNANNSATTAAANGGAAATVADALTQTAKDAASSLATNKKNGGLDQGSSLDPELVQLGALTAMVVVGAAAFESLSHHLTVNVFWV